MFTAAIDADQAWLSAVAVVNTVISLYYYLKVIAPTVLMDPDGPPQAARRFNPPLAAALGITAIATVGFGIAAQPLLEIADKATLL